MPRKRQGRGGAREGKPGAAYEQRTDLNQAPSAVPSKTYGDKTRQLEAQRTVPLPASSPPGTPTTGPSQPAGMAGSDIQALIAGLPGLTDPTQRPGEPLTAGLPFGPGAGPNALAAAPQRNDSTGYLRRMIAEDPDPELFALLAESERAQGGY